MIRVIKQLLQILFIYFFKKEKINIVLSLLYIKKPLKLKEDADYIRIATLELCYREIIDKNIKGNVAELGVFKGDFAKHINALFQDRKLYLFDTFSGFSAKDIKKDVKNNFSTGTQDFSDTSVEEVLKKMPFPKNCIIKKGYFPETAVDVKDSFCFVNIDTDLYEPIYQGLVFFYPKLVKGGYIFIHDFNNMHYPGAREAVIKFCQENQITYTPIPDIGGTVIITK